MKENSKFVIYLLAFLFSFSLTPATYINSSFLEQFVGSTNVGYIYTLGSIFSLIGLIIIRRFLTRFGNYKVFLTTLIISAIAYLILSLDLILKTNNIIGLIFVGIYVIAFVCQNVAFFNLDIFLERLTQNSETGGIRGLFLTSMNLAFILGPLIAGLIVLDVSHIGKIYALGAITLLPVIYITRKYFYDFQDSPYKKSDIWISAKEIYKNENLYKIFSANFILRIFYSWMVIYTPIFLHQIIGFSLGTVTIIIGLALLPFILLQAPLGKIADTKIGEKEILTLGFVITAISTILMAFISSSSILIWAIILFTTRIGASMIEIMTETHLFKKIDSEEISIMSLYRAVQPVAYILGPILASLLLIFLNIQYLFFILGIIILFGLKYSLTLKDTL